MRIEINDRITLKNNVNGTVKYIGTVQGKNGEWVGIELDEPQGRNDGSVYGRRYFECPRNHGLFVRYEKLTTNLTNRNIDQHNYLSDPFRLSEEEAGKEIEQNSELREENRKYKDLISSMVEKYNEALVSIKNSLGILQKKIEAVKKQEKAKCSQKGPVFVIVSEMVEADRKGDVTKVKNLFESFKKMMGMYGIQVE